MRPSLLIVAGVVTLVLVLFWAVACDSGGDGSSVESPTPEATPAPSLPPVDSLAECPGTEATPTMSPAPVQSLPDGSEITVDSSEDNDERDSKLTLREAILVATGGLSVADLSGDEKDNVANAGQAESKGPGAGFADVIVFDAGVFGGDGAIIELTSTLPPLGTGGDTVDGGDNIVTVDGGSGADQTEWDGSGFIFRQETGGVGTGFIISSDGNTIRGLRIYNFSVNAVRIGATSGRSSENTIGPGNVISANDIAVYVAGQMAEGNRIIGNFLGTDPSGTEVMGNNHGVWMTADAHDNTIGGVSEEERNIISSNGFSDVTLWTAHRNRLTGNYFGTDVTGTKALGRTRSAVRIDVGGVDNIIGGTTPGERNIFSGGNSIGIEISGRTETRGNRIIGNYIGLDATGRVALGNGIGVAIFEGTDGETFYPPGPTENVVGGLEPGERNIISGNSGSGISIANASKNRIVGNYIGTDCEGREAMPNGIGVNLLDRAKENVVGPANVISGNGHGVIIAGEDSFGNSVVGNIIGANAEDAGPLGNGQNGIVIRGPSKDNVIGGADDDGNIIAYNGGHDILIEGSSGNDTAGNSIHDNTGKSIETVRRGDIGFTPMIRDMAPVRVPPVPIAL